MFYDSAFCRIALSIRANATLAFAFAAGEFATDSNSRCIAATNVWLTAHCSAIRESVQFTHSGSPRNRVTM